MKKLLLIGGGGHAISCIDVIKSIKKYKIQGIIVNDKSQNQTAFKHLGNDNELSIDKIAKLVIQLSGSKSKIKNLKPLSDDPIQRKPNLTLANHKINWKPKVDIETGILKTIQYFKSQI